MKRLLMLVVLILSCQTPKPINVVLIIVDDLGWKDLSVTGSRYYQTPQIDRLAENSVRFDHFYSDSPVCSPTRAALMTGKHPARLDITNWIGGTQSGQLLQADYKYELPLEEITVAERFKMAGYATGFIGKWHLGGPGFFPEYQGFDVNIGGHAAGQPASYFWPYTREGGSPWDVPGLAEGEAGEYLTDRLTDEAISFMGERADSPFFLVLSHYSVHTPIQAKDEQVAEIVARSSGEPACALGTFENDPVWSSTRVCQEDPTYAAMVESTDEGVGRLLDAIEKMGLSNNTAVVFVSDNGGLSSLTPGRNPAPTSNKPLRAGKGYMYEGGIRIPFIVHDPRSSITGVRSLKASTVDVTPTLLDLAGLPAGQFDGRSLLPEAREAGTLREEALNFHFPHYHGSGNRPSGAIISGEYKLLEWFETGELELYHIASDQPESSNIEAVMPAIRDSLLSMMRDWRVQVDAKMPSPNPDWNSN